MVIQHYLSLKSHMLVNCFIAVGSDEVDRADETWVLTITLVHEELRILLQDDHSGKYEYYVIVSISSILTLISIFIWKINLAFLEL